MKSIKYPPRSMIAVLMVTLVISLTCIPAKAIAQPTDNSTAEAAQAIVTSQMFEDVEASKDVAEKLKIKADELITQYVEQRLELLKERYKEQKGLSGFDREQIDAQQTAEELDQFISDNFSEAADGRTQLVADAIDRAESLDAVYAITLAANIDARKINCDIASLLIKDLPASAEKTLLEQDIAQVENWINEWATPLYEGGLPQDFESVPVDYSYTGEGGSSFLKRAYDNMGGTHGVIKDLTNTIVGRASVIQKTPVIIEDPLVFESDIVSRAFDDFLKAEHPYYLNDTLRSILPELDTYASLLAVNSYTVTYTYGVEGSEVFPDQTFVIVEDSDTPAFVGTPERLGYTFKGWDPGVTETVTGDAVYTAQWEKIVDPVFPEEADGSKHSTSTTKVMPKTGDDLSGILLASIGAIIALSAGVTAWCMRRVR